MSGVAARIIGGVLHAGAQSILFRILATLSAGPEVQDEDVQAWLMFSRN